MSVRQWATFEDLTDVTLADEDTNSIPTNDANRAIQGNVAMQWCNLMANLRTNASGATLYPNFEPTQIMVAQFAIDASGSFWWPNLQSVYYTLKVLHLVAKIFEASHGGNILCCKWQVAPSSGQIRDQFK